MTILVYEPKSQQPPKGRDPQHNCRYLQPLAKVDVSEGNAPWKTPGVASQTSLSFVHPCINPLFVSFVLVSYLDYFVQQPQEDKNT